MQYFVAFSNKQKFVADGLPTDFDDVLRQDEAHIRSLYAAGSVRQAWSFDRAEQGGALLVEAASRADLDDLVASIPLVRAGYNDYQIYPLAPFLGFVV